MYFSKSLISGWVGPMPLNTSLTKSGVVWEVTLQFGSISAEMTSVY